MVNSSDDDFGQPSDENWQGNVISINEMDVNTEEDVNKTVNKKDTNPTNKDEEQPAPLSESKKKRKDKYDAMMDEKMKRLFATLTENTQKQLT
jgi:hypothetical protein